MKTTYRCNPTDLTNVRGRRMQLYVNGRDHTLVTLASANEVRQKIEEATDGTTWSFYFNKTPSDGVRCILERDLEAA